MEIEKSEFIGNTNDLNNKEISSFSKPDEYQGFCDQNLQKNITIAYAVPPNKDPDGPNDYYMTFDDLNQQVIEKFIKESPICNEINQYSDLSLQKEIKEENIQISNNDDNIFQNNHPLEDDNDQKIVHHVIIEQNDNYQPSINNRTDYEKLKTKIIDNKSHSKSLKKIFTKMESESENDSENEKDSKLKPKKKHDKFAADHLRNKLVNKCKTNIFQYTKYLCLFLDENKELQSVFITKQFKGNVEKNYEFIKKKIKDIFIDSPPKKLYKRLSNEEWKNYNNKEIIDNILNKPRNGIYEDIRHLLITIFNSNFSEIYEIYINDSTSIKDFDLNKIDKELNKINSKIPENVRCKFQTFKDDDEKFDKEESEKNIQKYKNFAKNLIPDIELRYHKKNTPVVKTSKKK